MPQEQGQVVGSGRKDSARGPRGHRSWGRDAAVVIGAVWSRPRLWGSALGALRRMARRGWWRRAPFLPVPGEQYWAFRLETAYGGAGGRDGQGDGHGEGDGDGHGGGDGHRHVVTPTADD